MDRKGRKRTMEEPAQLPSQGRRNDDDVRRWSTSSGSAGPLRLAECWALAWARQPEQRARGAGQGRASRARAKARGSQARPGAERPRPKPGSGSPSDLRQVATRRHTHACLPIAHRGLVLSWPPSWRRTDSSTGPAPRRHARPARATRRQFSVHGETAWGPMDGGCGALGCLSDRFDLTGADAGDAHRRRTKATFKRHDTWPAEERGAQATF